MELAIGTGTHTLNLSKTLMKEGSTLVCTEIAGKMLEMAKEKFEKDEGFSKGERNKAVFRMDEALLLG